MGPELGSKSAGRRSYHQRGRCTGAAVRNQLVHNALHRFSGFMDRKQLGRYGCSGSTFTDTKQIVFAITIISFGLAFAAVIISIGLKFFHAAILRIFEQAVAITIVLFLSHAYSCPHSHPGGNIRFRQPLSASRYFGKRVTRPYPASLTTATGQSSTSFILSLRPLYHARNAWGRRRRSLQGGGMVFLASTPAMPDCVADHQIKPDRETQMGLADTLERLSKAGATPGGGCVNSPTAGKVQKGSLDPTVRTHVRDTQVHEIHTYATYATSATYATHAINPFSNTPK